MKRIIFSTALLAVSPLLQAQSYTAIGYMDLSYKQSGVDNFKLQALFGKLGFRFNDYISAEARLGAGVEGEEQAVGPVSGGATGSAELSLGSYYGLYLQARYPLADRLTPYVIVGRSYLGLDISVRVEEGFAFRDDSNIGDFSEKVSGLSTGLGLDIDLSDKVDMNLEYLQLVDSSLSSDTLIGGDVEITSAVS